MAGGTWTAQNKVRPGIYINFKSRGTPAAAVGTRGTAAIPKALSWGPMGKVSVIEAGQDTRPFTGSAVTEPGALFLREMFKGTNVTSAPQKVLLYRLPAEGAEQAAAVIGSTDGTGGIKVTALYPGVKGNDIAVSITAGVDEPGKFTVSTMVDHLTADSQMVEKAEDLRPNDWVSFSGAGTLTPTAGVRLSGGADGTVQPAAYADALQALELHSFDVLAYDGTDSTVRDAMISFVKRLAEQEGKYPQLVTSGAQGADSRFVINCETGVVLEDGAELAANEVVWWLAGAEAGAQYYQSLSSAAYPGAADVLVQQSNSQIEDGILSGNIVLSYDQDLDQVQVETDINTLVTYTQDIGKVFHKNTTMRVCTALGASIYREFRQNYQSRVKNNAEGRGLFQGAVLAILKTMYDKDALRERPTGGDVTVEPGDDSDAIVITVAIYIGDNVEKVYLTIVVS